MTSAKFWLGGIWLATITLLISLPLLALVLAFEWRPIEHHLAQASQTVLKNAGLQWPTVTTHNRGRDVLVLGDAPNHLAVEQALALVRSVEGVRAAKFAGTTRTASAMLSSVASSSQDTAGELTDPAKIAPTTHAVELRQATLTASLNADTLTLTGELTDSDAVTTMVAAARQLFGENKVLNQILLQSSLLVDDAHNEPTLDTRSLADIPAILKVLKNTPFVAAEFAQEPSGFILEGQALTLTGIVAAHADRQTYWQNVAALTNGEVHNRVAVLDPSGRPPLENIVLVEPEICAQEIKDEVEAATINFEVEEAIIKPDSYALLSTIENALNSCPDAYFEIVGHADDTGNVAFNERLSAERARAVQDYLVALGINSANLTTAGKGSSEPLISDSSAQARAKNRRVEFVLINDSIAEQDASELAPDTLDAVIDN